MGQKFYFHYRPSSTNLNCGLTLNPIWLDFISVTCTINMLPTISVFVIITSHPVYLSH